MIGPSNCLLCQLFLGMFKGERTLEKQLCLHGHYKETFPRKTILRDILSRVGVRNVIHILQWTAEEGQA